MKHKTGLILLLALLIGTCTAFAKGEIERYQREKLDKLAAPFTRWLRLALYTMEVTDYAFATAVVGPDPYGARVKGSSPYNRQPRKNKGENE